MRIFSSGSFRNGSLLSSYTSSFIFDTLLIRWSWVKDFGYTAFFPSGYFVFQNFPVFPISSAVAFSAFRYDNELRRLSCYPGSHPFFFYYGFFSPTQDPNYRPYLLFPFPDERHSFFLPFIQAFLPSSNVVPPSISPPPPFVFSS